MKELSIQHLAEDTVQQLRGMGLSESTLSFYQNESFRLIIRFFKERGIQYYDYDVMCEYLRFEYSRFQRGEISLKRLRALELGANRFMRVAEGQKRMEGVLKGDAYHAFANISNFIRGLFVLAPSS